MRLCFLTFKVVSWSWSVLKGQGAVGDLVTFHAGVVWGLCSNKTKLSLQHNHRPGRGRNKTNN